jgi:hypothetical protein
MVKETTYKTNLYEEVCDDGLVMVAATSPGVIELEIRHEDRVTGLRSMEFARFRIAADRVAQIGEFITYVASTEKKLKDDKEEQHKTV